MHNYIFPCVGSYPETALTNSDPHQLSEGPISSSLIPPGTFPKTKELRFSLFFFLVTFYVFFLLSALSLEERVYVSGLEKYVDANSHFTENELHPSFFLSKEFEWRDLENFS